MKFQTAFFVLLIMIVPQSLQAHTKLSTSNPADGATVSALTEIQLEFSTDVRLTAVKLQDSAGMEMALGSIPGETAATYTIAVNESPAPGEYLISWRSISGDSHVVSGEIRFTVTG